MLSVNSGFTGTLTAEYAFTASPTREIDFEYDHNGLRTQKKVVENRITTSYDYTLHGKLITHLTKRVVNLDGTESSEELHFFYDAQSRPAFLEYENTVYRYVHNLQGDIVGLLDSTGALVVEYKYDAWGKAIATTGNLKDTLGKRNPFRYRGYVYDEETGLYYLRSRYYNPEIGRFLNADSVLGGVGALCAHDLFAYCINNPIMKADPSGNIALAAFFLGYAFLTAVGIYGTYAIGQKARHRRVSSPKTSITAGTAAQTYSADAIADGRHYPASSASIDKYKSAMEGATYYLAGSFNGFVQIEREMPLTFEQALIMLGITSCTNLSEYYSKGVLTIGENGFDPGLQDYIGQTDIYNRTNTPIWGIYTKDSLAAEGLAFLLGSTAPNEITNGVSGYYHYHDPAHIIHIWFGLEY